MTLRSTPRESIDEETTEVRQRQLEEAQKHILYIRYQRCGLTKETMQAMTFVTGDSAIWPGVPFAQYVHHVAFCDELSFRVLPIVLVTVKGHRRDRERCSWTLVTLGRYVGSGREVPFDISSWTLAVSFIVPRQSAHGRRMRSSAMPPGEHHNDFTLTMPGHDHHTSSIDDGAGIFHRNESWLQRQKATEEQRTKEEEIKAKSRAKALTKKKSSQAVEDEWLWGDISKEGLSNESLQADSDDDLGFRMHVGKAMHTGNLDAHRRTSTSR